jgi:hypothetical protein
MFACCSRQQRAGAFDFVYVVSEQARQIEQDSQSAELLLRSRICADARSHKERREKMLQVCWYIQPNSTDKPTNTCCHLSTWRVRVIVNPSMLLAISVKCCMKPA